ncbi:kinase [Salirhabdus salicampi]|uniref:kinase n=1 Tax=Salirhabdus salicampi TaxID=476102 RepID=UPI0020C361D5|nr:kinase [Salirhabdus salicampi]MCP8616304.1 kinase [Salirhabdus salicampi]
MRIKEILEISQTISLQFSKRLHKDRPFIVGIDGLSGAGKTTIANQLLKELNMNKVMCLHIDDYIVEREKRYHTGFEEWYEYYYLQWDTKRLIHDVFVPLRNKGSKINLPYYHSTTDTTINTEIEVTDTSIVMIEGIFLQRKEWREYFDFVIYVDCPRKVKYKRVLQRDSYIGDYKKRLKKYKRRYWPGEQHYVNLENPMEKANIVYKT